VAQGGGHLTRMRHPEGALGSDGLEVAAGCGCETRCLIIT